MKIVDRNSNLGTKPVIEAVGEARRGVDLLWLANRFREIFASLQNVSSWLILLKNSIAAATLSVVEKVDPLERSQSDANERGDCLRPQKLLHEKGETSFS